MTRDPFPRALRERLAPAGVAVPHPGAFASAPLPATTDEAVAQFQQACEAVGGRVSRVTTAEEAAALALGYLDADDWRTPGQVGPGAFVAWEATHLPLAAVPSLVEARGATRLEAFVHADAEPRGDDYRRLDAAVVGITGADAALADTGSVVLVHGTGRPRLVSLLPPVHVVLVDVSRLRATLGALLDEDPQLFARAANVVVVTGPSRTADIEMTLTRGVHGPRVVHVVFVG